MPKRFDPTHAEAHGYTRADWDAVDAPPLTDEELATARPFQPRGPQKAPTKTPISIRLDPRVVAHFKAEGVGWQTRVNDALLDVIKGRGQSR